MKRCPCCKSGKKKPVIFDTLPSWGKEYTCLDCGMKWKIVAIQRLK